MTEKSGVLGVVSAIVLWSSLGVFVRLAHVDVQYLIFYANLLSLFLLAPIVFGRGKRFKMPRGKYLLGILALGPVTVINTFTFLYALKHTTISNALMTHYIAPVVVAVLAAMFLGEKFTKNIFVSIVIASTGLWILLGMDPVGIWSAFTSSDANAMGLLAGLASGVAYAFLIVIVRAVSPGHEPLQIVFMQNLMMCLLLLPFIREFPMHAAWAFILSGILHSTAAPIFYVSSLRYVQANKAAILGYLEPVSAILMALVILGEVPSVNSLWGGSLILLSGYIVIRSSR